MYFCHTRLITFTTWMHKLACLFDFKCSFPFSKCKDMQTCLHYTYCPCNIKPTVCQHNVAIWLIIHYVLLDIFHLLDHSMYLKQTLSHLEEQFLAYFCCVLVLKVGPGNSTSRQIGWTLNKNLQTINNDCYRFTECCLEAFWHGFA